MPLAFIATGDIALPTFQHLLATGRKPLVLITQPDKPVGRSQSQTVPPKIKTIALEHGIPVWQPEKIGEIASDLAALEIDTAIVMAYGQFIGRAVRQAPRKAMINLHASLLPKYRGASCIQAAIANGDAQTGITIMHVERVLDSGNIICAKRIDIGAEETAGELHDRLAELGPSALDEALERLESDSAAGTPQDPEQVTYAPKLLREDGRIDFTRPAKAVALQIRGYHPWPGTFTEIPVKGKTKRLKIFPPTQAVEHTVPEGELVIHEGQLLIGCGEGTSLILSEVQPEGSKRMPATAFANSL